MKNRIKNIINKYFPDKMPYISLVYKSFKNTKNNFIRLRNDLKKINYKEQFIFGDSNYMNCNGVIQKTFLECYTKISNYCDLIYYGELTKGSHRFMILEEDAHKLIEPIYQLMEEGYIVHVYRQNQKSGTYFYENKNDFSKRIGGFDTLRVFKPYKNKNDVVEFSSKLSFEIEKWRKIEGGYITRTNNGLQNQVDDEDIENTIDITIFDTKVKQLFGTYRYFNELKKQSVSEVDIVYTWVNGNDPDWLKRKKFHNPMSENNTTMHESAFSDNRYISRDELKYSLRSIEKYLLGYRNLYIVTDKQIPDWLKENDRVKIIDHKDIFPDKSVLPVFNSHAIEACLHLIPNLSEHYLYLNDDILFGRFTDVSRFFPKKGKINIFPSTQTFIPFGEVSKDRLPVDSAAINTRKLLMREGLGCAVKKFKHTPLPQIKSILHEIVNKFSEEIDNTRKSKFRQPSDISITSSMLFNYALLTDRAQIGRIRYFYINMNDKDGLNRLKTLPYMTENKRPDVFCVNDVEGEGNQELINTVFKDSIEKLFSYKSSYEK